ncbi:hypothetical protein V496_08862 [Pseudogymnoascus sp. VKM F-4515 (FW-2607)]|nr:hypothetical protein V496_08862 [Pseudogymnoascus sp. VKM F-4515 (FW-2607)]KFY97039.1 hypothetical protein V498_02333 [Pseudogymnoascus sp. VKM F-4517 (FW-2822)]
MSDLYAKVNDHYSSLARENTAANEEHIRKVALSFGYNPADLSSIPDGANLGVSCGNPLAIAGLKEGETVVDLGSGGGFDVFQAAGKVGPTGKSIGVDLSDDMLELAAKNLSKSALTNVSFVKAPITATTLPSGEADCIISNCVINLVPGADKALVFSEIWRLLKPGGRVAVSDILARKELSPELKGHLGLYVGCISGASLVGEYEAWLRGVGFQDVLIVDKKSDLNIYKERTGAEGKGCGEPAAGSSSCCGTKIPITENDDVANIDFNEWVGSFEVYAVKPADA